MHLIIALNCNNVYVRLSLNQPCRCTEENFQIPRYSRRLCRKPTWHVKIWEGLRINQTNAGFVHLPEITALWSDQMMLFQHRIGNSNSPVRFQNSTYVSRSASLSIFRAQLVFWILHSIPFLVIVSRIPVMKVKI